MTKDNHRGQDGREIALEPRHAAGERLHSPSAAKNRDVILDAFDKLMPSKAHVLEIGTGTGEHAVHLCTRFPDLTWQPSDPDETSRASIAAWAEALPPGRIASPLAIRTDVPNWWSDHPLTRITAGVCINMIHIAPWAAVEGLFNGMAILLPENGKLFLYGPYQRDGQASEGNARFDADLKRRNPDWGVRDLERQIVPLADQAGFDLAGTIDMPSNNLSVAFKKR